MSSTYFGGSRSLPSQFSPLVASVVQSVLSAGQSVRVGCAAGGDAAVIRSVLAAGQAGRLSVFAVGSASGAGFWSGSALAAVRAAASAGAAVFWSAGGSVRKVPLPARLIKRSMAGVAGSAQAVFFLASKNSKGSLAVAGRAASAGLPVFAFACGFSGSPAPLAGAGQWVRGSFAGRQCWQWQPAQQKLF
jgi:hypothetical protein